MVRGSADGRVGPGGGQAAAGHHQNNIQHQYHVSYIRSSSITLIFFLFFERY